MPRGLDVTDQPGKEACGQGLDATTRLQGIADNMAGYASLPMARHERAASSPEIRDAFVRFVERESRIVRQPSGDEFVFSSVWWPRLTTTCPG